MHVYILLFIICTKSAIAADKIMNLIEESGYSVERHRVDTEDGYILTLHRIPQKNSYNLNKKIVLLAHGLWNSAAEYLIIGPGKSLGYVLSDAGYDVWLVNSRGNTNSRQHKYKKSWQKEFWNFSWHEIGIYDLPIIIDYILTINGQSALHFIGHSQGGTAYFVMLSEKPKYGEKIITANLLAPVITFKKPKSPYSNIADQENYETLKNILINFEFYEILPSTPVSANFATNFCSNNPLFLNLCKNLIHTLFGTTSAYTNKTLYHTLFQYTPAGSSYKQFLHYAQVMVSGKFRFYDHGSDENVLLYNQTTPPEYNLISNVHKPMHLYYGTNDAFVSKEDIQSLANQITAEELNIFEIKGGNHVDFIYADDISALVNECHGQIKYNKLPRDTL